MIVIIQILLLENFEFCIRLNVKISIQYSSTY